MTATPIPRTLAITAFGEMDVSIIDELPAGRKEIETHWMKKEQLGSVLAKMAMELEAGRQAYVICPLIEESDKLDVQNAVEAYEHLATYFGSKFKVGLMHGRLHSEEKDAVMRAFSEGDIQVLVSTTVVEVGINVPNATVMMVENAQRFGLAQLHQLRGRIGRKDIQSYCIFMSGSNNKNTMERLQILNNSNDGFKIASEDLKSRGPGDLFGLIQSGRPEFRLADIYMDADIMQRASEDAKRILDEDPKLELEKNKKYKDKLVSDNLLYAL